ncbi:hypothetical protein [Phytoactinopolyspora halotolerans]|uniref:Uncharacterized protein n=1 Tax=Phytoactinopolyspora halotolerans TaxID=1981512 RepID=A0A6L9SJR5_9ACTN|nr:hypothetical protein [Phytoactinopolyspora halotolerans]NEE04541.1 hypothetical protein [Phytoactinopolyspora halotolerans]
MSDELRQRLQEIATAAGNAARDGDVAGVRAKVRKGRRRRMVVATGVVVMVAVASVGVVVALDGSPDPSVAGGSWEACGQDVETAAGAAFDDATVFTDDGPVGLRLDPLHTTDSAEAYVAAETTYAASGVDRFAVVNVDGSPLALWVVDGDGRVVGTGRPTGGYPDDLVVTPPDSTWMDVGFEVRSCGDVAGTSRGDVLPPGDYDIVAGIGVAPAPTGQSDRPGRAAAVVLAWSVLIVGEGDDAPAVDSQCGAVWPQDAVTSTGGDELGIRLDGPADLGEVAPQDPTDGDPPGAAFTVTAANTSDAELEGWTGHPWIVVVRDRTIVGTTGGMDDVGLDATMEPGTSMDYDAWVPLHDCTTVGVGEHANSGGGDPLAPGTYELYAVMEFFFTTPAGDDGPGQDRTDVTAVGGPWTVTVP